MAVETTSLDDSSTRRAVMANVGGGRRRFAELIRRDPLSTSVTIFIDVLSATVAVLIAWWWNSASGHQKPPLWPAAAFVPTVILLLLARNVYGRKLNRRFIDEVAPVAAAVALASMLLLTGTNFAKIPARQESFVTKIWICTTVMMLAARLIRAYVQRILRRHHHLVSPTLIVGNGLVAHQIIERLAATPEYGLAPIGILDTDAPWIPLNGEPEVTVPHFGSPESIEEAILSTRAEAIVIAFSRTQDELLARVIRVAHRSGLRVWVVPRMFDVIGKRARVEHIGGLPLLSVPSANAHGWNFTVKHVGDRILAAFGLLLICVPFLIMMLLVRLSSPGPIFFRQARVGRDGKVFDCVKFRTMRMPDASVDFAPRNGVAPGGVEGADRRTKIGKILRSTSMDELPQLINVIKGEMSLVGPRPERPEFVEVFEAQIRRYGERHRVKAGMTGWAQVHGLRGQTSIADRAEWDNFYIENWSLGLDIKILALTVPALFRRAV
jgi:exopolysaccharide biosynthesis polyprenyl glycosylphosphotransferase